MFSLYSPFCPHSYPYIRVDFFDLFERPFLSGVSSLAFLLATSNSPLFSHFSPFTGYVSVSTFSSVSVFSSTVSPFVIHQLVPSSCLKFLGLPSLHRSLQSSRSTIPVTCLELPSNDQCLGAVEPVFMSEYYRSSRK